MLDFKVTPGALTSLPKRHNRDNITDDVVCKPPGGSTISKEAPSLLGLTGRICQTAPWNDGINAYIVVIYVLDAVSLLEAK